MVANEKTIIIYRCIDGQANSILSNGSYKAIELLEIGDKLKTLDSNGHLIDTDVVMMIDIGHEDGILFIF